MPGSYLVNPSDRPMAPQNPSRGESGLPEEGFVFCSFNQGYKVTPRVYDVWMRLLKRVPTSILWLPESNRFAVSNLKREAEARGIQSERLVFAPRTPSPADHFARLGNADLFLDTWPYNAHATASDALWVGCPVLTLPGETFASRVAGSLLKALGLSELIAESPACYEELAISLAKSPERLRSIRDQLHQARETKGLFDPTRFARNLEQAYFQMWDLYRSNRPANRGRSVSAL